MAARPKAPILAVDDDPDFLRWLRVVLAPLREPVLTATTGEEALDLIASTRFAVLVLDVFMPGMDGLQLAARIREDEGAQHTPIIFLSVERGSRFVGKGYNLRAFDYLFKPCDEVVIRAKVEALAEVFKRSEEVRQREAAVLESEKLAALGRLAATVAHEISTPLQFLTDNNAFLMDNLGPALAALRAQVEAREADGAVLSGEDYAITAERLAFLAAEMPQALENSGAGIKQLSEVVRGMCAFAAEQGGPDLVSRGELDPSLVMEPGEHAPVLDAQGDDPDSGVVRVGARAGTHKKPRLLCVDDHEMVLAALSRQLETAFEVVTATSGEEALACLRSDDRFDVIVTDANMPNMNGASLLEEARRIDDSTLRIMLSGSTAEPIPMAAKASGAAHRLIQKPYRARALLQLIQEDLAARAA